MNQITKKLTRLISLEDEIGLSSYDLALISNAKKYSKNHSFNQEEKIDLLSS